MTPTADLPAVLQQAQQLAAATLRRRSPEAQERPEDVATRDGSICLRLTPAQRHLIDGALAPDENPASFTRQAAIVLALLRAQQKDPPVTS
jgi:hypothetical protein